MACRAFAVVFVFAAIFAGTPATLEPLGLICRLPEGGQIILAPLAAQHGEREARHRPPAPEGYGHTLYGLRIADELLADDLYCKLPEDANEPPTSNYCARFDGRGKVLGAVATFPHDAVLDLVTDLGGISSYVVPLRNCVAKRIRLAP